CFSSRRRHTRCYRDWSSDVCSSDLISRCKAEHKLHDCFLRAGEQADYSITKDHNGYRQEGLHVAQAFIHKGYRWSSARGYLRSRSEERRVGKEGRSRCLLV